MEGHLDSIGIRSLRGWAMSEDHAPLELVVRVNDRECACFLANAQRPDLARFGRTDLGFDIQLDDPINIGDVVAISDRSGRVMRGTPLTVRSQQAGKEEKALALVNRGMKILEIGPGYNPIAPRSRGWDSYSLDHATQQELQAKYAGQQAIENIEPVDFVWRGGPIEGAIPSELIGTFGAVIVSHVIEHFPDPIAFYKSAARILEENGIVSLVVPDKRVMFDFFKPVSMTSDLLHAHYHKRTRHSRKTAFDNIAYNVAERGNIAWTAGSVSEFAFLAGEQSLEQAMRVLNETDETETTPYVDFHNTVYVPSSFELIILELGQLGIIPFSIARTYPQSGCEFYVTLQKKKVDRLNFRELALERLRLAKGILREQAEQARWILGDQ